LIAAQVLEEDAGMGRTSRHPAKVRRLFRAELFLIEVEAVAVAKF
jgi:hypothetical protein